MTVYGIANLTITDRATCNRYAPKFLPILRQYEGTLLVAADDQPNVIEGEWASEKIIVVSFDDEGAFRRWYDSPEYQAIVGDRFVGAHGPLLLARGARSA
jgi:uncharacterized protein (DUF1330 family)